MEADVQVSRDIAAPADRVWALVTDLPRMAEWSGENTGGTWLAGATEAAQGATFRGANRNGWHRWSTKVTVDEFNPATRFSFSVWSVGLPMAQWSYDIEETDEGCRVTESWTDRRPGYFKPISRAATGVVDRAAFAREQMSLTLANLAETVRTES